jgi:hypothetical protein
MGDWSDFFEAYPEENPANYVGDHFDPKGAARQWELEAKAQERRKITDTGSAALYQKYKAIADSYRKSSRVD